MLQGRVRPASVVVPQERRQPGGARFAVGERGRGGKPICLTEAGVKLAEQTVDLVIESEQKALLDFSVEEQAQLLTLTRRYNEALSLHFGAIGKEKSHE